MVQSSIVLAPVTKVNVQQSALEDDMIAVEEPLEIKLSYCDHGLRKTKSVSVTMRTPGNDTELALGFLFTEGIISNAQGIKTAEEENGILVTIPEHNLVDFQKLERHFYTTSSCGVCGKTSVDAIRTVIPKYPAPHISFRIDAALIYSLTEMLNENQSVFQSTGGLHASALFRFPNEFLMLKEDVGRHNALDKLIGEALNKNWLPLHEHILLLSGRASFELVQKAAMAGIPVIAAVGAPSSLAIELAKEFGITLIGFLRNERFNIYSGKERILL